MLTISSQDEAAIQGLFDRQNEAWARGDGDAFAAVFAADADFINITAHALRGRADIAGHHAGLFATVYRGTTVRALETRIRLIHPDVATIERLGAVQMGAQERRAHMLAVAVRKPGGWELQALHNMIPFNPPPAPA